jgi:hypothetical protein
VLVGADARSGTIAIGTRLATAMSMLADYVVARRFVASEISETSLSATETITTQPS